MTQQVDAGNIYGAETLVSDGTLTPEELALLEGSDAVIMDNGGIVEVAVNEETPEETPDETPEETPEEVTPKTPADELARSRAALGEIATDLTGKGIDVDSLIEQFSGEGALSDENYAKLAEAGYSKTLVDSVIAGQRAAVEAFTADVLSVVGGADQFKAIAQYASVNSPDLVAAYNAAIERTDAASAKAILTALSKERTAKLGTSNRQVQGKPAAPAQAQPKGFSSEAEMVSAINDRRYRIDPKYTREVESKIAQSSF